MTGRYSSSAAIFPEMTGALFLLCADSDEPLFLLRTDSDVTGRSSSSAAHYDGALFLLRR